MELNEFLLLRIRVAALERRLRWTLAGCTVLGCWLLMGVLTRAGFFLSPAAAAPGAEELRVSRLVLVDGNGDPRAELGQGENGGARLVLFQGQGSRQLVLGVAPTGSVGLSLVDGKANTRLAVALDDGGNPGILLKDAAGTDRIALYMEGGDSPTLALADKAGKLRLSNAVLADDTPVLELRDRAHNPGAVIAVQPDDESLLELGGSSDAAIRIRGGGRGMPVIRMVGKPERATMTLGATPQGAGICVDLHDRGGSLQLGMDLAGNRGRGTLSMAGADGQSAAVLTGGARTPAGLLLFDAAGNGRIRAVVGPEGPAVQVHAEGGQTVVQVGQRQDGAGELKLADSQGKLQEIQPSK